MLTYGDMMTLLLTFFVLLFSMSTLQTIKFQAQMGVIQGSMGISQMYQHSPMSKHLPSPSVKPNTEISSRAVTDPESTQAKAEYAEQDDTSTQREQQAEVQRAFNSLGISGEVKILVGVDEIILILPTYAIFNKGEWQIHPENPAVQRVMPAYTKLAQQINMMVSYDVHFVGHTDSLPFQAPKVTEMPRNNMELGFLRAVEIYEYFFGQDLKDRSRITFSSQGDNVPLIPNAHLDSERRKNRRVEIHLKKRK
jgi:chemotaxis protein MotB